jgi:alpha-mannosidase
MTDAVTSSVEMHPVHDAIERLRALTQVNVQNGWQCYMHDLPVAIATQPEQWNDWSTAELNPKDYIVWSAGRQVLWLSQRCVVPQNLQGYPLTGLTWRLVLTWWAESAQIFVNGQLVQEGDLFDSSTRVLLSTAVMPGEEIAVALRLVSPGHDIGGLMRSRSLYESNDDIDPGFVADELAIFHKYVAAFEPEKLDPLVAAVAEIAWDAVSQPETFKGSLSTLRQNLQCLVGTSHTSPLPKQRPNPNVRSCSLRLSLAVDSQRNWEVAQRTFESVLTPTARVSDLTFAIPRLHFMPG